MMRVDRAREYRAKIEQAAMHMPDTEAFFSADLFPVWTKDTGYKKDDRRREGAQLYKCLQPHTSQAGWEPSKTPALWVAVPDPAEEWPLIPNPITSTNPWMKNQKGKTADGRKWISLIDGNVWQPTAYPAGWSEQK